MCFLLGCGMEKDYIPGAAERTARNRLYRFIGWLNQCNGDGVLSAADFHDAVGRCQRVDRFYALGQNATLTSK